MKFRCDSFFSHPEFHSLWKYFSEQLKHCSSSISLWEEFRRSNPTGSGEKSVVSSYIALYIKCWKKELSINEWDMPISV